MYSTEQLTEAAAELNSSNYSLIDWNDGVCFNVEPSVAALQTSKVADNISSAISDIGALHRSESGISRACLAGIIGPVGLFRIWNVVGDSCCGVF